jgi:hypothetical protein
MVARAQLQPRLVRWQQLRKLTELRYRQCISLASCLVALASWAIALPGACDASRV